MSPFRLPHAPRRPQRPSIPPREGPRGPQDGPKTAQDGPKTAQEVPKTAPEGSKTAPRGVQEGDPKFKTTSFPPPGTPGGSKSAPRGRQRPPGGLQDAPGSPQEAPRRPPKDSQRLRNGPLVVPKVPAAQPITQSRFSVSPTSSSSFSSTWAPKWFLTACHRPPGGEPRDPDTHTRSLYPILPIHPSSSSPRPPSSPQHARPIGHRLHALHFRVPFPASRATWVGSGNADFGSLLLHAPLH